jgi:hypothetical protein
LVIISFEYIPNPSCFLFSVLSVPTLFVQRPDEATSCNSENTTHTKATETTIQEGLIKSWNANAPCDTLHRSWGDQALSTADHDPDMAFTHSHRQYQVHKPSITTTTIVTTSSIP